ncbi:hypothetical protein CEXT_389941 [Caerostris extrusa]|uniref:Uncharacterized protein n=1 Tax=Caerostris extrusa TaxID=172846 RepID=A0AAV4M7K6_CAEEX|nr:hypothetical protein CEXT_389941 [Caerostris extrusa]
MARGLEAARPRGTSVSSDAETDDASSCRDATLFSRIRRWSVQGNGIWVDRKGHAAICVMEAEAVPEGYQTIKLMMIPASVRPPFFAK